MAKLHIKKGDTVYVNAGDDKGKTGRVLRVLVDKNRAVVEGVNIVSKSTKPISAGWHCENGSPRAYFEFECVRSQIRQADPYRSPSQ